MQINKLIKTLLEIQLAQGRNIDISIKQTSDPNLKSLIDEGDNFI